MKLRTLLAALPLAVLAIGPAPAQTARESDTAALQPFNVQMIVSLSSGCSRSASWNEDSSFKVPAGKRAVIEMVTIDTALPAGQVPRIFVGTVAGGAMAYHRIPVQRHASISNGGAAEDLYEAQTQVKIYADPLTPLRLAAGRDYSDAAPRDVLVTFTLSGYYVNLP